MNMPLNAHCLDYSPKTLLISMLRSRSLLKMSRGFSQSIWVHRNSLLGGSQLHNNRSYNRAGEDLSKSSFYSEDLSFSNLKSAKFYSSDLRRANLRNSNLMQTTLINANLIETRFSVSRVSRDSFKSAKNLTFSQNRQFLIFHD